MDTPEAYLPVVAKYSLRAWSFNSARGLMRHRFRPRWQVRLCGVNVSEKQSYALDNSYTTFAVGMQEQTVIH